MVNGDQSKTCQMPEKYCAYLISTTKSMLESLASVSTPALE